MLLVRPGQTGLAPLLDPPWSESKCAHACYATGPAHARDGAVLPLEMEMQDARGPGSSTPALLLPGQSERADGKGAQARWWGPRASNEHIQVRMKMKMHCQQLGQVSTMPPFGLCCPAYNCKCHL